MTDKFALLEEKVDRVIGQLSNVKDKNANLSDENSRLVSELTRLGKTVRKLELAQADQSELVKTKLVAVLERLSELEAIAD